MSHPSSFQRRVAPPWGRGQTRYVSTSLLPPRILCLDSNATAPAVVTAAKTRCCATARDRRLAHSEPRPRLRRGIRLPYPAMPAGPRPWPCTSAAGFPCADSPRHMARVPVALWVPARLARLANVLFRLSRRSSSSSSHKMPAITFPGWARQHSGHVDEGPGRRPRQTKTATKTAGDAGAEEEPTHGRCEPQALSQHRCGQTAHARFSAGPRRHGHQWRMQHEKLHSYQARGRFSVGRVCPWPAFLCLCLKILHCPALPVLPYPILSCPTLPTLPFLSSSFPLLHPSSSSLVPWFNLILVFFASLRSPDKYLRYIHIFYTPHSKNAILQSLLHLGCSFRCPGRFQQLHRVHLGLHRRC